MLSIKMTNTEHKSTYDAGAGTRCSQAKLVRFVSWNLRNTALQNPKWRAAKSPGGEPGLASVADTYFIGWLSRDFNEKFRLDLLGARTASSPQYSLGRPPPSFHFVAATRPSDEAVPTPIRCGRQRSYPEPDVRPAA